MGILVKLVDRFFGSLKKGLSDNYEAEADKAGMSPEGIKAKKELEDEYGDLMIKIRKLRKK